jgi:hypothetical protein
MAPGGLDAGVAPCVTAEWASSAIAEAKRLLLNIDDVILLNLVSFPLFEDWMLQE